MNKIYDSLGQEIKVGDFVAAANGSYVRQEFGIVNKLGNKQNARVSRLDASQYTGSFVDSAGLVVINDIVTAMSEENREKFDEAAENVVLDHTRPKSTATPKYIVRISPKLNKGWVCSFQNDDELKAKSKMISQATGDSFVNGTGEVSRIQKGYFSDRKTVFVVDRYGRRRKSEWQLSLKSVTMLGIQDYIDNPDGFDLDIVNNLEPIDLRFW